MSPEPARSRRPAVPLLLGALLTLLTLGLLCGTSADPGAAAAGQAVRTGQTQTVRAVVPAVSVPDGDVGCGKLKDDRSGQPGAPNRGASTHEQLVSTLSYEHTSAGDWTADGHLAGVTPDRGPPPRDPPSPVELSVLRV